MHIDTDGFRGNPELPIAGEQDTPECQGVVETERVGVAEPGDSVRLRGADPRQLGGDDHGTGRPKPIRDVRLIRIVDLDQHDIEHLSWRQSRQHLNATDLIEVDQDAGVGEQRQAGAPSSQRASSSRTSE